MSGYLQSLEKFGMNLGLERIKFLLECMGNPHLKFKAIHVAGTNGKGSTCAMIASILKEAGYRVGLYTSPHLFDYTERIKVDGKDIPHKDFKTGLKIMKQISNKLTNQPTIFEVLTAVAFWYFAKKKVDYAVIEVGLGGRLDATNVITPLVSVITNIDLEHTKVLGNTLAKIAKEKVAIIKPGVPIITAENKSEPIRVMKKAAVMNRSLLVKVGQRQLVKTGNLIGTHQKINAACAIAAVRLAGIRIGRSAIRRGLQKAEWPARFQIISKKPLVIVDGAHNPAGVRVIRVTVQRFFPAKYTIIFGCQQTKDFKKMLAELKPIARNLIITRSSHQQAAAPERLARGVKGVPFQFAGSFKQALGVWDGETPLLICGSLFLAADALQVLLR